MPAKFPLILFCISYCIGCFFALEFNEVNLTYTFAAIAANAVLLIIVEYKIKYSAELKTYLLLCLTFLTSVAVNSMRVEYKYCDEKNSIFEIEKSNKKSHIIRSQSSGNKYFCVIENDSTSVEGDEFIGIIAQKEFIEKSQVPFSKDYNSYLLSKGIKERIFFSKIYKTNSKRSVPIAIANYLQHKLQNSTLNDNSKAMVLSLVLGDKRLLDPSIKEVFSDIGVMHILALSGLHLGLLSFVISRLLSLIPLLNRNEILKSTILISILFLYSYITSFSPSIARASIMFATISISQKIRRPYNLNNSLALSALILLIVNPNNLLDLGFQFSYAALLGISIVNPMLSKAIKSQKPLIKYFAELTSISISTQISTAPLALFNFGKFSGLFLISNLLIIPIFTAIIVLSYLQASTIGIAELKPLSYAINHSVDFGIWVSMELANFDFLTVKNFNLGPIRFVSLYLLIASLLLLIINTKRKSVYMFLICVVLFQLSHIEYLWHIKRDALVFENKVFAIKSGNCFAIKDSTSQRALSNYLKYLGPEVRIKLAENFEIFEGEIWYLLPNGHTSYSIELPHHIVLNKNSGQNPFTICNANTKGIIIADQNSPYKKRWEYFANKMGIAINKKKA